MAARLGTVIYWAACVAAVVWATFIFIFSANSAHPDWTVYTPIAIVGAIIIWGVGRAACYLLARR